MRRADAELDHFQSALDVALGVGDGLAMFGRQGEGQFVHVAVQEAHEFHHHAGTALRVGGTPFDLRLRGVRGGRVKLGLGGQRHLGLHFASGRVEDVGAAAGRARHMLAVDPVSDLFHRYSPFALTQNSLAEMPGKEARFQKGFAILQGGGA